MEKVFVILSEVGVDADLNNLKHRKILIYQNGKIIDDSSNGNECPIFPRYMPMSHSRHWMISS